MELCPMNAKAEKVKSKKTIKKIIVAGGRCTAQ